MSAPVGGGPFLETLGIVVVAAALVVTVARRLRMPTIVAYIVAGLLVGPVTGLVVPAHEPHGALETVSEMGIVLLMFLVGTELSFERIRQVGKVALAAGIGQVVFTAAGGLGVCYLLGFDWMESIFIATALTFSSTVVVVKLLDQKHELHSLYGRIAVGIFLVQDLVVVVVLTFLAGLGRGDALEVAEVASSLGLAFGGMGALLVACLLAAKYVLPGVFGWASRAPRTLFMWSLAWCFGLVVASVALGLSVEIGAFLAGLSVAQLHVAHDLRRRLHPLMSFFIAVFFVSLGAQMELTAAKEYWQESLWLSLFVLVGNPFIFMIIIARYGYSERTAFLTSVTVAQISEFSFIFTAMGVSTGLIEPPVLAIVGVVGLVTIATSAYMILYNHELYAWLARRRVLRVFRAGQHEDAEPPSARPSGHVVVVGMNDLGTRLARALHDAGEDVLAIDTDPRKLADMPCKTMTGDVEYPSTLEEAGLPEAKLAISALRIETTNKYFTFMCRHYGVPAAVYALDRAMLEQLQGLGAACLVESKRESGERIIDELRALGVRAT
jgi:Kef-type K+ transport system membrane component KefB